MTTQIIQDRLERVLSTPLSEGKHQEPNGEFQACVIEAAAYIAGESWSDQPKCVCPVIRRFMISWNDELPSDTERDRLLKPLLTKVVGTRNPDIEERRSYMALDWLVRVHAPKFLELTGDLKPHAQTLRDLDEIVDLAGAMAAGNQVFAARAAARNAAWDAAGGAARAAAWDAAWDAAWAATGDAARAAARAAARDAVGAATGDALAPTVEWLQASASDLVVRMCELEEKK